MKNTNLELINQINLSEPEFTDTAEAFKWASKSVKDDQFRIDKINAKTVKIQAGKAKMYIKNTAQNLDFYKSALKSASRSQAGAYKRIGNGREYPKFEPGMMTSEYIIKFQQLNANRACVLPIDFDALGYRPAALYENGAVDFDVIEESIDESDVAALANEDVAQVVANAVAAVAIDNAMAHDEEIGELVTCEAESERAEHGAMAGSANPQTVNSGASNNVIFADFRPAKAAETEPVQVAPIADRELVESDESVPIEIQRQIDDEIHWCLNRKFSPSYLECNRECTLQDWLDANQDAADDHENALKQAWINSEPAQAEPTGWTSEQCEAELKEFQAHDRPTIQSKSGAYCAWFYMLTFGKFGLRFAVAGQDDIYADFESWHDRMVAVQLMGSAIDNPTDNPPTGEKPENGMPEQAQDGENTAVGAEPGTPSAVSSEGPGMVSAVSTDFDLVETFKKNPLALLAQGMTVNELVGLGVHYPGHMSSASDDGAVTSIDDSRGQRFGGLRLHCTLEDGRVVIAEPHYFEDDIRPIMQFNGKRHGDEYLSQLLSGAAMRKASESSAVEQAAKDHAQALIDLVGQYPQLTKSENKHAGGKLAASNARILLKAAFKGQKFSVRSDYNSMRIEWIDGPTSDQVNDVVGMFDIGASDSQSDYFYKEHTAFSDLFGGVQYLNTRREFSDGMVQQAIDTLYPDAAKRPPLSDWRKAEGAFSFGYSDEWARSRMNEILNSTSAYKPKAK